MPIEGWVGAGLRPAVDLPAVTDLDHQHYHLAFIDLIDHPIVADANPAQAGSIALQRGAAVRVFTQTVDGLDQAQSQR
ncbi:hypothetical protein JCM17961_06550 [Endothiovibrio diazotrophicus]